MYHVPVTEGGGGSDEDEDVGPPLPPGYTTQVSPIVHVDVEHSRTHMYQDL